MCRSHHRVLDIGSGIGGPSRYLSYKTGCRVVGIELQQDAIEVADDITARCGLADKIDYKLGNFMEMNIGTFRVL